ncbi:HNH endonuclease [Cetobacterium sp.]|uniref:HNH endonuclease n=1 Tax=Cetobacterium sp. TaxID=2071632 RepID=UPI003F3CC61E
MKEFLKDYCVSEDGKVYYVFPNQKRAKYYDGTLVIEGVICKERSTFLNRQGYRVIKILGKHYRVGRLVLTTFKGEPENSKMQCDHINRIATDDRLENLRWLTNSENMLNRDNSKAKYNLGKYLNRVFNYEVYKDGKMLMKDTASNIIKELKMSEYSFYKYANNGLVSPKYLVSIVKCND